MFQTDLHLSKNFRLSEFLVSDSHPDLAAKLEPTPVQLSSLTKICIEILEPIRAHVSATGLQPVIITSGLRSPELNAAIAGSPTSQHLHGEAADIALSNQPRNQTWNLFEWVRLESNLPFCQLIIYRAAAGLSFWRGFIHVGIPSQDPGRIVEPRVLVHDPISPGPPAPYWPVGEWLQMRRDWGG